MTVTVPAPTPVARPRLDQAQAARLEALRRFVAEKQRPPRRHAISPAERSLAEWMVQASGQRGLAMAVRRVLTGEDKAVAQQPAAQPVAAPPKAPRRARPVPEPDLSAKVWVSTAWVERNAPSGPPARMPEEATADLSPIQRLRALQRFMDTHHRLPRPDALEPEEQEMAVWMRAERRAGNKFVSVAIASRGLR